jgi:hypothetical protein
MRTDKQITMYVFEDEGPLPRSFVPANLGSSSGATVNQEAQLFQEEEKVIQAPGMKLRRGKECSLGGTGGYTSSISD